MNIQDLLNPSAPERPRERQQELRQLQSQYQHPAPLPPYIAAQPTTKSAKDQPVYRTSRPKQPINYPPHDAPVGSLLHKEHKKHSVFPLGNIIEYASHIPYASEKKRFGALTGRSAFEVFVYEFKLPDSLDPNKKFFIYWDYMNGLVRMTNIFKACGFPKTTPNKALNTTPGLKGISHSITGGNLEAQGYWVPYKAAKALAATFCFNIRFLLVPVFGEDFMELCIPPGHKAFSRFDIDQSIVQDCIKEANEWLAAAEAKKSASPDLRTPFTPNRQPNPREWTPGPSSSPKGLGIASHYRTMTGYASSLTPAASPYGESIVSQSSTPVQPTLYSPEVSPKSRPLTGHAKGSQHPSSSPLDSSDRPVFRETNWTPINLHSARYGQVEREAAETLAALHTRSTTPLGEPPAASSLVLADVLHSRTTKRRHSSQEEDELETPDVAMAEDPQPAIVSPQNKGLRFTDARAANVLLDIRADDSKPPAGKKARRASK
ncbi:hypothetical protein BT63DRAFT_450521 [Microthyrium microscopicum]|uniref:HTH APSES-type domain-containing protein n=1 Tax=Microthyrium microscopicum TaxID=703497 RepID=A0A6A6UX23_9PEZI|nr:hypothetical protein BT63DRAFT_450521 [Microthyrium microscopicum]